MNLAFLFLILFQLSGFCQEAEELDPVLNARLERAAKVQKPPEPQQELSIMDNKGIALMQTSFEKAALWEKSPEVVRELLISSSKGKWTESAFQKFPKLLDFFVDLLRDKAAVLGIFKIMGKKELLKQYSLMWLVLMVGTWLVKKYLFPPEPNFWRRSFTSLIFSIFVSSVSMILFYVFFKNDISPTVEVAARHFWF